MFILISLLKMHIPICCNCLKDSYHPFLAEVRVLVVKTTFFHSFLKSFYRLKSICITIIFWFLLFLFFLFLFWLLGIWLSLILLLWLFFSIFIFALFLLLLFLILLFLLLDEFSSFISDVGLIFFLIFFLILRWFLIFFRYLWCGFHFCK